MDPVLRRQGPVPLHEAAQLPDAPQALVLAVDEVGVVRDVGHDLGPRGLEGRVPLGLDGPDELDQVQAPAGEGLDRSSLRPGLVAAGVDGAHVEEDEVVLVEGLGAPRLDEGDHPGGIDLEDLVAAVIGEEPPPGGQHLARHGGIADAHLPDGGPARLGDGPHRRREQENDTQERSAHVEPRSTDSARISDPRKATPVTPPDDLE